MSGSFSQDSRQSELIKTMRFPLMILVLFEHSVRDYSAPMMWSLDSANVFHFITEMISHFLCPIAVSWFFFFSGFLYYYHLGDAQFGWRWARAKWKRRVHSVLIPYLFWNLLTVGMVLLVTFLFGKIGITINSDQMVGVREGPLFWFFTGPINYPLWYLRDLVVMSFLAPIFYYPVKNYPWHTLAVLLILYIFSFKIKFFLFPTFSLFGIGAWFSIRRDNLIDFCQRVKYPAAVLAVILLFVATALYNKRELDDFFRLLFLPFGMVTFLNVCNKLFDRPDYRERMTKMTETVFFTYAAHEIYILGWTKGLFLRLFGETLPARWISYLFVPVVTLAVCLGLFYLIKYLMPRTLAFACGWRTIHKTGDGF